MPASTEDLMTEVSAPPTGILSIAELYDEVEGAVARAFPRSRQLWVRGEIQSTSDQNSRSGHCYIDLIDPETAGERQAPVLRVKCWRATWGPLRSTLARSGIELAPGMVVHLRGTLDFYRPRAEIGFILVELDVTALLGRLAAERAALLKALAAEGLLERNRTVPLPDVPLRVGLVASPGTEGYRDFVGQLRGSGFAFAVTVVPTTVQGAGAPAAIAAALGRLAALGIDRLDLAVVVRGGGSKGDLAAFDAEPVARAIATSPLPVWTGVGHTGDESVADLVANRSFITPTECGRELALVVGAWWSSSVADAAARLCRGAFDALTAREQRGSTTRTRLAGTARHMVGRESDRLRGQVVSMSRCAPQVVADARSAVVNRAARLGPLAMAHVERAADRSAGWRRLLAAYDLDRQLERGYTLTHDEEGKVVRSVAAVMPGNVLLTRFADGSARSVVAGTTPADRTDPSRPDPVRAENTTRRSHGTR